MYVNKWNYFPQICEKSKHLIWFKYGIVWIKTDLKLYLHNVLIDITDFTRYLNNRKPYSAHKRSVPNEWFWGDFVRFWPTAFLEYHKGMTIIQGKKMFCFYCFLLVKCVFETDQLAVTCDCQKCGILTTVDSDEPVQKLQMLFSQ